MALLPAQQWEVLAGEHPLCCVPGFLCGLLVQGHPTAPGAVRLEQAMQPLDSQVWPPEVLTGRWSIPSMASSAAFSQYSTAFMARRHSSPSTCLQDSAKWNPMMAAGTGGMVWEASSASASLKCRLRRWLKGIRLLATSWASTCRRGQGQATAHGGTSDTASVCVLQRLLSGHEHRVVRGRRAPASSEVCNGTRAGQVECAWALALRRWQDDVVGAGGAAPCPQVQQAGGGVPVPVLDAAEQTAQGHADQDRHGTLCEARQGSPPHLGKGPLARSVLDLFEEASCLQLLGVLLEHVARAGDGMDGVQQVQRDGAHHAGHLQGRGAGSMRRGVRQGATASAPSRQAAYCDTRHSQPKQGAVGCPPIILATCRSGWWSGSTALPHECTPWGRGAGGAALAMAAMPGRGPGG